MIRVTLFWLFLILGALQAQEVREYKMKDLFKSGHSWSDSLKDHGGDSIGVYVKGVLDSVKLDMMKTTTSADDIVSNDFNLRGGNNDISIAFRAKNISGTMKGLFKLGIWSGIDYTWQTVSDTIRSDSSFVYNFIGQTWAKQVSDQFVIRWQETGAQQNKIVYKIMQYNPK